MWVPRSLFEVALRAALSAGRRLPDARDVDGRTLTGRGGSRRQIGEPGRLIDMGRGKAGRLVAGPAAKQAETDYVHASKCPG